MHCVYSVQKPGMERNGPENKTNPWPELHIPLNLYFAVFFLSSSNRTERKLPVEGYLLWLSGVRSQFSVTRSIIVKRVGLYYTGCF